MIDATKTPQLQDLREMRAQAMLGNGFEPHMVQDNIFNVPSQSSSKYYTVINHGDFWTCSCPDFTYRNVICKHIIAIRIWTDMRESVQQLDAIEITMPLHDGVVCKYCDSDHVVKNGTRRNKYGVKNRYLCKACKRTFVLEDNGFAHMKFDAKTVTKCLDLYFKGASLRAITDHMRQFYDLRIHHTTITHWIRKYIDVISDYVSTLEPSVSGMWHADEMMINVKDNDTESKRENLSWLWNVMDTETRFLLATLISKRRSLIEAKKVLKDAKETARGTPDYLVTDGLYSYNRASATELSTADKFVKHIRGVGIRNRIHNNKVERLHGTIRDREKTMRAMDNPDSAEVFIDGFKAYYNYIRPHKGLNGKTPAQEAGIELDLGRNRWMGLIKKSIEHQKQGAQ